MRVSQCFRLENLPVQDASSTFVTALADIYVKRKLEWMGHFLRELHRKFELQGRKVVMIVDKFPAHPEVLGLKAINSFCHQIQLPVHRRWIRG